MSRWRCDNTRTKTNEKENLYKKNKRSAKRGIFAMSATRVVAVFYVFGDWGCCVATLYAPSSAVEYVCEAGGGTTNRIG